MPVLVTKTPEGVSLRREIAGAGSRYAAVLLDALLVMGGFIVIAFAVSLAASIDPTGLSTFAATFLAAGWILGCVLYWTIFGLAWEGQTPGKRVIGLRVASADGNPAGAAQHVLRGLFVALEWIPIASVPFGIAIAAFTPRRQRLGDLVAGTVVLRERRARKTREPWSRETWTSLSNRRLALHPGMAARLDARDLDFLRDVITRTGLAPDARRRLFVSAARHYSERLDLGPFDDARIVLKEIYLFAREARRSKEPDATEAVRS